MPKGSETPRVHRVEFKTLRDLFFFIMTKSIPGQQFLSVIRYRDYTYTFTPVDDSIMIFFTKEQPKGPIYAWDVEKDEFISLLKADRSKINFMIQDVVHDSLISSLFYP